MSLRETFHPDVNGHALNVKTHGVRFADGGTEAQRVRAWSNAQEAWWRDADEAAREAGYAGAGACGRSGGWCAPYDEDANGRMIFVHKDNDAERFNAFAEKIDALMRDVPEYFTNALNEVIAEDEAEAREAEEDRAEYARERAILALVPRLVAALQMGECTGDGMSAEECERFARELHTLQSGDVSQPEAWRVTWESDSDAATPEKAARAALADIRRRGSIAHVFSVRGRDGRVHVVDLNGTGADA